MQSPWGAIGIIGYILGLYRDDGNEHGSYYNRIGNVWRLYRDNGKENGKLL